MDKRIAQLFDLLMKAQKQMEYDEEEGRTPVLGLLLNTDGFGQLMLDTTTWLKGWYTLDEGVRVMQAYVEEQARPKIWSRDEHIPAARFAREYPDLYRSFLAWVERSCNYPPEVVTHFNVSFLNDVPMSYSIETLDEELMAQYRERE